MDITKKKIAIIGLGYVGLPLAVEFGRKYSTLGFDINDPYPLGIIGPKGMATATVQKLHDALKAAIETPAMEKVMYDAATPKLYMNTADFTTWAHKAFVTKGQTMTRIGLAKRQPRK